MEEVRVPQEQSRGVPRLHPAPSRDLSLSPQENGRPKLELVPNSGVYITHPQLDDLSQVSTDKPKLMTRRLLGYFFSRETLARSSATGQRIAHNNTTMERPLRLPVAVVNAIKGRGWGGQAVGWGPSSPLGVASAMVAG